MKLVDFVKIDHRFEKSVNLLLDLNDESKLKLYIPTRSSIKLMTEYLEEVNSFSGKRANILIGPYGKGKSHLLLVLLAILSGNDTDEMKQLICLLYTSENHFTWGAIKEVAVLFVGIFITMQPALMILKANGANLGITEPFQMFWSTGFLSSFLDLSLIHI